MHTHVVDHARDGRHRWAKAAYLHFTPPDNPVCWALGHTPRVRIEEPRWEGHEATRVVDCRVCGRRHHGRDTAQHLRWAVERWVRAEGPVDDRRLREIEQSEARALMAGQVRVVREHGPEYVARNIDRRAGWERGEGNSDHVQAALYLGRGVYTAGWSLSVGTKGSETPLDLALYLPWASLYAQATLGRRWAHLLTSRTPGEAERRYGPSSREHQVVVDVGSRRDVVAEPALRAVLWGRKSESSRTDRWWERSHRVDLNPLDHLWGHATYRYEDVQGPLSAVVRMPDGDEHLVDLTLRRQTFGRPRGGRQQQSWTVSWSCQPGIPYRRDAWKGDEVTGSGVTVTDAAVKAHRWVLDACAAIAADVSRMRSREGWTLPDDPAKQADQQYGAKAVVEPAVLTDEAALRDLVNQVAQQAETAARRDGYRPVPGTAVVATIDNPDGGYLLTVEITATRTPAEERAL